MTSEPEVTEDSQESSRPKRKASRRGVAKKAKPRSSATPKPVPDSVPVQPTVQPTGVPLVRRVVLRNRRGQMLTPSILNENGTPTNLRLGPFESATVIEDRITDYTRDMVAQGHLSVDPAR